MVVLSYRKKSATAPAVGRRILDLGERVVVLCQERDLGERQRKDLEAVNVIVGGQWQFQSLNMLDRWSGPPWSAC